MNLKDVHITNKELFVENGKGKKDRIVHCSPLIYKEYIKYKRVANSFFEYNEIDNIDDYVFLTREGKQYNYVLAERAIIKIGNQCTIRKAIRVSPHSFRHYFAQNRQLAPEMIHSFTDATGQEVKIAFIDFELDFPVRNEKMNTAADLEIRAMSTEKSCITQAFVDEILGKSKDLIEKADLAWEKSHANLQEFTNDEYQSYMEDKGAYFTSLKEQYLTQNDVDFAREVLETAKGNNQFKKDEDVEGTETTETVAVPDEKPVKENTAVADESAIPAEDLLGLGDLSI